MIVIEANGARMPALGFGTSGLKGEVAAAMVEHALGVGYRHVDTAAAYGNEAEVGEGVRRSSVPRDRVWLTTKIWHDRLRRDDFLADAEDRVRVLGTEPDLLLIHWPNAEVPLAETIGALDEAARRGLASHVGISNFPSALIREAVALSARPLVTNQVEYHPGLDQGAVLGALAEAGMALTAYSPIAKGAVARDPVIVRIAEAHGRTPVQVTLRWLVQQPGVAAIPRSSDRDRVASNFEIWDFALSEEEMDEISSGALPHGRLIDPGIAPRWD